MPTTWQGTGVPVNGTSGTLAGANGMGKGDSYVDLATGYQYFNSGTSASPVWTGGLNSFFYGGGVAPVAATTGTDVFFTNGTFYLTSLFIPAPCTLTGLAFLIGSVGGTDKVITYLWDSTGAVVANAALAGATVGTLATWQRVDFTATYAARPGMYYAGIIGNGVTAKFRAHATGNHPAGQATGTFGTNAAITPPTTFTADKAPFCSTY